MVDVNFLFDLFLIILVCKNSYIICITNLFYLIF